MPPVSVNKYTEHGRPQVKRSKIRTRTSSEYPVSGASDTPGSGESSFPVSKAREIIMRACQMSSQRVLSFGEVSQFMGILNWDSHLIPQHMRPLQQHFYALGLTDHLVLPTLLRQWQDLSFLTSGVPIRPLQADFIIFTDASTPGWALTWRIPRFRVFGPAQNASSTSVCRSSWW